MEREFTVAEAAHVERIRGLVGEMHQHLKDAVTAHEKGIAKDIASAHTRLGRCLRSADVTFAKMAADAVQADIAANHKAQTSAGVTEGTSAPERGSPLYTQGNAGIPGFLARARPGGRRS